MSNAKLTRATLAGAQSRAESMSGKGSEFVNVDFTGANLDKANLYGDFQGADFTSAQLRGAKISVGRRAFATRTIKTQIKTLRSGVNRMLVRMARPLALAERSISPTPIYRMAGFLARHT